MAPAAVTRPLVQQVPRREGEEIVLAAPGDRELRLGGDALGRMADELIIALVEHGVAVDGADAWRHFHAQSSVRAATRAEEVRLGLSLAVQNERVERERAAARAAEFEARYERVASSQRWRAVQLAFKPLDRARRALRARRTST